MECVKKSLQCVGVTWSAEEVRHAHELLTQHALFSIGVDAKKGTLSQHFMTHIVPPLPGRSGVCVWEKWGGGGGGGGGGDIFQSIS